MPFVEEFVRGATAAIAEKCSLLGKTTGAAINIPVYEMAAFFENAETSSRMKFEKSRNRSRIYNRFLEFKCHYSSSIDSDGKLVFYFLCNVEALPSSGREEMIFKSVVYIEGNPDSHRVRIAELMRRSTEIGLLPKQNEPLLDFNM
jgi:hypothetical protein